jgi:hypothetical protein
MGNQLDNGSLTFGNFGKWIAEVIITVRLIINMIVTGPNQCAARLADRLNIIGG